MVGTAGCHDRIRGLDVLFQQKRRDRKHVGDVIEAVTRVVRRELFFRLEIESRQVANRVAVLGPIEPANRAAARIDVVGIDPEYVVLDPVGQHPHFVIARPRLPGRRHQSRAHVLEHAPSRHPACPGSPRPRVARRTPAPLSSCRRHGTDSSNRSRSAGRFLRTAHARALSAGGAAAHHQQREQTRYHKPVTAKVRGK